MEYRGAPTRSEFARNAVFFPVLLGIGLKTRFLFVDGLRGLASLSVALFHIGRDFLGIKILFYGGYGVTVFFVLSGFVISHSIIGKAVTGKFFATFALKRSIRLDPAYWVAIALAMMIIGTPGILLGYKADLPSLTDIAFHLIYVQDILRIKPIDVVFWSLCYEVQFYVLFCGILFLLNKFWGGGVGDRQPVVVFAVLLAVSLLWPLNILAQIAPGLFINLWFLFLLGVFARWGADSLLARLVLGAAITCLLIQFGLEENFELAVGSVTAALLFLAIYFDKMRKWLNSTWIQYFGRISYSLYLVHNIVGLYVRDTGLHILSKYFGSSSLLLNYICCAIALAASIVAAHLLYRYVEFPSHALSRRTDIASAVSTLKKILRFCGWCLKDDCPKEKMKK